MYTLYLAFLPSTHVLVECPELVLGSLVSRLEKDRDWTGTELEMTGNLMDRKRPRLRSGPRSNRFKKQMDRSKTGLDGSQPVFGRENL
jgi:hypothetical protein